MSDMASVARQAAFGRIEQGNEPLGGEGPEHHDAARHLGERGQNKATADSRGRQHGRGNHQPPSNDEIQQLANQLKQITPSGIERAVANLGTKRKAQHQHTIPWQDSPLNYIGPKAVACAYHSGSLLRPLYSFTPWNGGRDGQNTPLAGKPFKFATPGYNAKRGWDPTRSDIPNEWVVQQIRSEVYRAQLNCDHQYNMMLLAMGRYSHVRV
jgi:hypothetical protein